MSARSDSSEQSNSIPRSCITFAVAIPLEPAPTMHTPWFVVVVVVVVFMGCSLVKACAIQGKSRTLACLVARAPISQP